MVTTQVAGCCDVVVVVSLFRERAGDSGLVVVELV